MCVCLWLGCGWAVGIRRSRPGRGGEGENGGEEGEKKKVLYELGVRVRGLFVHLIRTSFLTVVIDILSLAACMSHCRASVSWQWRRRRTLHAATSNGRTRVLSEVGTQGIHDPVERGPTTRVIRLPETIKQHCLSELRGLTGI